MAGRGLEKGQGSFPGPHVFMPTDIEIGHALESTPARWSCRRGTVPCGAQSTPLAPGGSRRIAFLPFRDLDALMGR